DLAEHVLFRHLTAVEDKLSGRGGPDSKLVLFLADSKAFEVFLDYESCYALVSRCGVNGREEDKYLGLVAVRDPQLLAGDLIMIAFINRFGRQCKCVGARASLAKCVRTDAALGELRHVLSLLLV